MRDPYAISSCIGNLGDSRDSALSETEDTFDRISRSKEIRNLSVETGFLSETSLPNRSVTSAQSTNSSDILLHLPQKREEPLGALHVVPQASYRQTADPPNQPDIEGISAHFNDCNKRHHACVWCQTIKAECDANTNGQYPCFNCYNQGRMCVPSPYFGARGNMVPENLANSASWPIWQIDQQNVSVQDLSWDHSTWDWTYTCSYWHLLVFQVIGLKIRDLSLRSMKSYPLTMKVRFLPTKLCRKVPGKDISMSRYRLLNRLDFFTVNIPEIDGTPILSRLMSLIKSYPRYQHDKPYWQSSVHLLLWIPNTSTNAIKLWVSVRRLLGSCQWYL